MRKMLSVSILLNAAFVAGLMWKELAVHAAGGGGTPKGNGDVNGDGAIDISDGIYILGWLFAGGNAPVPITCPPNLGKGLPATGQTICYKGAVDVGFIDCASSEFPGQDGFYQAGCPAEGRFVVEEHRRPGPGPGLIIIEDTVMDNCTGLMWMRNTADVNRDFILNEDDRVDWQTALKYSEDLSFAGHTDWRLPNVRELQSIVDYGRFGPSIDPVFGAFSGSYWSSSTYEGYADYAWGVYFWSGDVDRDYKGDAYYVRAVRSGP